MLRGGSEDEDCSRGVSWVHGEYIALNTAVQLRGSSGQHSRRARERKIGRKGYKLIFT